MFSSLNEATAALTPVYIQKNPSSIHPIVYVKEIYKNGKGIQIAGSFWIKYFAISVRIRYVIFVTQKEFFAIAEIY